MTIIYIIAAFAAGALIAWFAGRSNMLAVCARQTAALQAQHASAVTDIEGRAKGAEAVPTASVSL